MTFGGVVGHAEAAARLARAAAEGRVPAAVLLVGPAGIGKRALAERLMARLLCQRPQGLDACGECKSCMLLKAGSHPDNYVLEPEEA